jgi:hypothetical protein
VYYIDQLAEWIVEQGFDFVYWNMLHEIDYFSISTLPHTVKTALNLHLKTCNVPEQFRQEFDRIVDFMNGGESLDGSAMLAAMRRLDQRRNQNLTEILPELAGLIGYEN